MVDEYPITVVVGLGPPEAGVNDLEGVHEGRENVRAAVAGGVRAVRDLKANVDEVVVDDCHDAEAAAEGAVLGLYYYDDLKSEKYKKPKMNVSLANVSNDSTVQSKWNRGVILADGQNLARRLMETPANLMTPTIFSETVAKIAEPLGIKVVIRDQEWAKSKKMGSFLSVAQGSDQPPKFLELHYYNNSGSKPLALVGKGITFDSGGISLKPSSKMDQMRADMGGAANVVSAIITLANLKAKVNVIGLTPLTENLPSGKATKPGDVFTASNGKTIQVDNTDAEGRLVLADALHYAHEFDPRAIVDLATLTGAMGVALGSAATGVFSNTTEYFNIMQSAGVLTGDRVWRMPLFNHYTKQTTDAPLADLNNIGSHSPAGGACTAAAFLREFVTHPSWMHMDIAGVMGVTDEVPYLCKGMSGRPLRTLVNFSEDVFGSKTK